MDIRTVSHDGKCSKVIMGTDKIKIEFTTENKTNEKGHLFADLPGLTMPKESIAHIPYTSDDNEEQNVIYAINKYDYISQIINKQRRILGYDDISVKDIHRILVSYDFHKRFVRDTDYLNYYGFIDGDGEWNILTKEDCDSSFIDTSNVVPLDSGYDILGVL